MEKNTNRTELRERIIATATRLFHEQGVKSVRMDDVASNLGISKKTLYEVYSTKENLLLEVVKLVSEKLFADVKEIGNTSNNVLEQIYRLYKRVMKQGKETTPLFFTELIYYPRVKAYLESMNAYHTTYVKEWLLTGVKEGLLRDDINYEVFFNLSGLQVDKLYVNPMLHQYSVEEVFNSICAVMLKGLATEKGLEIIKQWK